MTQRRARSGKTTFPDWPPKSVPEPAGSVAELLEVATELVNAAAEQSEDVPPVIEEASEPEPIEEMAAIEPQSPEQDAVADEEPEPEAAWPEPAPSSPAKAPKAGFSAKLLEGLASVGFYGKNIQVEPDLPAIPVAEETSELWAIEESLEPETPDDVFVGEEDEPVEPVEPVNPSHRLNRLK